MKVISVFIIQFHLMSYCVAQTLKDSSMSKIKLQLSAGVGQSIFATNTLRSQSKFPTTEVRLGLGVIKRIGEHFDLISYLNVGSKIKGDRVFPPGSSPPGVSFRLSPPFNELEETVNSRNHHFVEIPFLAQFSALNSRIGLRVGGNYRHFFQNKGYLDSGGQYNEGPDFLSNKKEFGVLGGVSIRIFDNLKLTTSYCFGLTKVNAIHYAQLNNFKDFRFDVRNQFSLAALEYIFK